MNIKNIAKLAGVSVATVSRVINNSDNVRPETRDRIREIMKQNNYIPSAIARDLSFQRSEVVAVIVPDLQNPFFYGLIEGITQIADKSGYQVLIFNTNEDANREFRVLQTLRERHVAGILITAAGVRDERTESMLAFFQKDGIPVILIDRDLENGDSFDSVMADNEGGAYKAISELVHIGHRRIAIIAGEREYSPVYEREVGYRRALAEANIPIRSEYIAYGDQMVEKSYRCMADLLSLPEPPTAVFCGNNMMLIGAMRYLYGKGIRVGKEIGLIGFDDIELLNDVGIKISVVARSERKMGRKAMELLLAHREGGKPADHHVLVTAKLILRGSEKCDEIIQPAHMEAARTL